MILVRDSVSERLFFLIGLEGTIEMIFVGDVWWNEEDLARMKCYLVRDIQ